MPSESLQKYSHLQTTLHHMHTYSESCSVYRMSKAEWLVGAPGSSDDKDTFPSLHVAAARNAKGAGVGRPCQDCMPASCMWLAPTFNNKPYRINNTSGPTTASSHQRQDHHNHSTNETLYTILRHAEHAVPVSVREAANSISHSSSA